MKKTLFKVASIIKYNIKKEALKVLTLLEFLVPYLYIALEKPRTTVESILYYVLPIICLMLIKLFKLVYKEANNILMDDIKVRPERITVETSDGIVSVKDDKLTDAVLYLNELENSFERIGKTRA